MAGNLRVLCSKGFYPMDLMVSCLILTQVVLQTFSTSVVEANLVLLRLRELIAGRVTVLCVFLATYITANPITKSLVKVLLTRVLAWVNQPGFSGCQTRLTRLYHMCKKPGEAGYSW